MTQSNSESNYPLPDPDYILEVLLEQSLISLELVWMLKALQSTLSAQILMIYHSVDAFTDSYTSHVF